MAILGIETLTDGLDDKASSTRFFEYLGLICVERAPEPAGGTH